MSRVLSGTRVPAVLLLLGSALFVVVAPVPADAQTPSAYNSRTIYEAELLDGRTLYTADPNELPEAERRRAFPEFGLYESNVNGQLSTVYRVLRPNGRHLLTTDPNGEGAGQVEGPLGYIATRPDAVPDFQQCRNFGTISRLYDAGDDQHTFVEDATSAVVGRTDRRYEGSLGHVCLNPSTNIRGDGSQVVYSGFHPGTRHSSYAGSIQELSEGGYTGNLRTVFRLHTSNTNGRLSTLYRVLRPNGSRLITTDPNGEGAGQVEGPLGYVATDAESLRGSSDCWREHHNLYENAMSIERFYLPQFDTHYFSVNLFHYTPNQYNPHYEGSIAVLPVSCAAAS